MSDRFERRAQLPCPTTKVEAERRIDKRKECLEKITRAIVVKSAGSKRLAGTSLAVEDCLICNDELLMLDGTFLEQDFQEARRSLIPVFLNRLATSRGNKVLKLLVS